MSINPQSLYQDDWIKKTLGFVGYSCLVYNHALTLDKEVEFIWPGPWTFTKAVFLINRYGNLICQTFIQVVETGLVVSNTANFCRKLDLFTSIFLISSAESVHILVLLRAWALWGCWKREAAILAGSYVVCLLFSLIMAFLAVDTLTYFSFQYMNLPEICVAVIHPNVWVFGVANACQDTIVFGSTMLSLRRHSRDSQNLYPSALLRLLIRDAVVFYIASIFFDVFNVAVWIVYADSPKNVLTLTFSLNLLSIAGQRLVLNLRGVTARSYGRRSLSAEVDRQLQAIGDARPEWWNSGTESGRATGEGVAEVEEVEMVGMTEIAARASTES